MRVSRSAGTILLAGACAGVVALTGCTVDGSAVRAGAPSAADGSAPAETTASSASTTPSKSASKSKSSEAPSSTRTSTTSAAPASATGMTAKAWDMTCHTYRRLDPAEQKEVTDELGRRLGKKQLRENERSWAIVNSFCDKGLVRNSPGVRDSS